MFSMVYAKIFQRGDGLEIIDFNLPFSIARLSLPINEYLGMDG